MSVYISLKSMSVYTLHLKSMLSVYISLQVDVIESQWNVLQARIQNSNDFTELVGYHQE